MVATSKPKSMNIDKDLAAQMERAKQAGRQRLAAPEMEVGATGDSRTKLAYRCMKEAGFDAKDYIPRWGNPRVANGFIQNGCIPVPDLNSGTQVSYGDEGILFAEPRELYERRIAKAEYEGDLHNRDVEVEAQSQNSVLARKGAGVDIEATETKVPLKDLAGAVGAVANDD